MDTFMDKLAQKFNAQDMIKANSAAEAAENAHLKDRLKGFEECLGKLQKMLEEGSFSPKNDENGKESCEETLKTLREEMEKLQKEINSAIAQNHEENQTAIGNCKNAIDALGNKLEEMTGSSSETELKEIKETVNERGNQIQDEVHKECVKVYRNVQAVILEESEKQQNTVEEKLKKLQKKQKGLTVMMVLTLLASLAGVAFQVLLYLKVL